MALARRKPTVSLEELRNQELAKRSKRIKILIGIMIVIGCAKFFIKPPPPPKIADHSKKPFRAVPGVLNNMSVAQQQKLTPEMLSALRAADENALKELKKPDVAYLAQEALPADVAQKEEEKILLESRLRKRQRMDREKRRQLVDESKSTVVIFRNGRFVKVEQAQRQGDIWLITYTRGLVARVSVNHVREVLTDAVDWVEPTPRGYMRIEPAMGVTMVIPNNAANRINALKGVFSRP